MIYAFILNSQFCVTQVCDVLLGQHARDQPGMPKSYLRVGGFTCSRTQLVRAKNRIADNWITFFISEDYQLSV